LLLFCRFGKWIDGLDEPNPRIVKPSKAGLSFRSASLGRVWVDDDPELPGLHAHEREDGLAAARLESSIHAPQKPADRGLGRQHTKSHPRRAPSFSLTLAAVSESRRSR
jgi:hypothetical protein